MTPAQEIYALSRLKGLPPSAAAAEAGVTDRTLRRWHAIDGFRDELLAYQFDFLRSEAAPAVARLLAESTTQSAATAVKLMEMIRPADVGGDVIPRTFEDLARLAATDPEDELPPA